MPEETEVVEAEVMEEDQESQAQLTPDEIERAILKRCDNDFEYSRLEKAWLDRDHQEWRRIYNGRLKDETKDKFPNSLFIRETTSIVQRLTAAVLNTYFEREHLAGMKALNPNGMTPLAADIATKVVRWHLKNSIDAYLLIEDAVYDAAVDSTACVKMGWERKFDEQGNITYNRPFAEVVPLEDVFPDPNAKTQEDLTFVIHEKEVDVDYLRQKGSIPYEQGGYKNVDEIIEQAGSDNKEGPYNYHNRTDFTQSMNRQRQMLHIREYWGKLQMLPEEVVRMIDTQGGQIPPETLAQDVIVTTFEDKTLLRVEPNTYGRIPFFFGRLLRRKDEYRKQIWGESVVELVRELQRELNSSRNQRRRYAKRAMSGRIILGRNSGVNRNQLRRKEDGGIIDAEDVNQVKDFKLPDISRGFDSEIPMIERDFEKQSGITAGFRGMERPGRQTATEFQGTMTMAVSRVGAMIQTFNLTLVEPMIEFLVDMVQKWETSERVTRIIGANVPVPPLSAIFDRELDVNVEAGISSTTTAQQIQEVQMATQVVSPLLSMAPQVGLPVVMALTKKLLELLPLEGVEQVWEQATGQQQPGGPQAAGAPVLQPGNTEAEGQGQIAGRGTFSGAGQPPARPPAPRPVMPGQVQGGMRPPRPE